MKTLEAVRLKENMAKLVNKWKDKKTPEGSIDWFRRRVDQTAYLFLKGKLEGKETTSELAKEVFKNDVKANEKVT